MTGTGTGTGYGLQGSSPNFGTGYGLQGSVFNFPSAGGTAQEAAKTTGNAASRVLTARGPGQTGLGTATGAGIRALVAAIPNLAVHTGGRVYSTHGTPNGGLIVNAGSPSQQFIPPGAAGAAPAADSNTMLLLGGAALLFVLMMRGKK